MSHSSSSSVFENLETFYENWLTQQQHLLRSPTDHNEEAQKRLIDQVLAHYLHYHDQKIIAAEQDFFYFLSAPWLSSYERALLWVSGIKPSLVFRLLKVSVRDLSGMQEVRVEMVRVEVRRKEREITAAMASLQETVAAPPFFGTARRAGKLMDGEINEMDNAVEEVKKAMVGLMERADVVRGSMMNMIMEILSSEQMLKLLSAAAEFQLRIRRMGTEMDLLQKQATLDRHGNPPQPK